MIFTVLLQYGQQWPGYSTSSEPPGHSRSSHSLAIAGHGFTVLGAARAQAEPKRASKSRAERIMSCERRLFSDWKRRAMNERQDDAPGGANQQARVACSGL